MLYKLPFITIGKFNPLTPAEIFWVTWVNPDSKSVIFYSLF